MLFRNLLLKFPNLSKMQALPGHTKNVSLRQSLPTARTPIVAKEYATVPPTTKKEAPTRISTMMGLREFLSHPLTWDRNNGYFNILLGIAIFGYCFCTACHIEKASSVNYEADRKK